MPKCNIIKRVSKFTGLFILFYLSGVLLTSFVAKEIAFNEFYFPYKEAGLTRKQAAAHLISRFSFGATPGQVDEVADNGLEKWFLNQLKGGLPDDSL
ncbi:MAG TPA: hypothetical protein VM935_09630, partial [Chitinophagaceae bacterium]|nr:hypothetical protein [Chitinophagaceae bacterium]